MKNILVLEDQRSVMRHMRLILKQYTLIEAPTAQEALFCSIDVEFRIDLLVADLTLPISSGIAVARTLRSKIPALPVILTSRHPVSNWSKQDSMDLEKLGSQSVQVVQKPFEAQSLLCAVRESLGESHVLSVEDCAIRA
jgi:DNA-binding response OmpR family regulator